MNSVTFDSGARLTSRVVRCAPGLAALLGYRRADLPHNLIAGLSVAAVALPVAVASRRCASSARICVRPSFCSARLHLRASVSRDLARLLSTGRGAGLQAGEHLDRLLAAHVELRLGPRELLAAEQLLRERSSELKTHNSELLRIRLNTSESR
jgi:hypothetical protein